MTVTDKKRNFSKDVHFPSRTIYQTWKDHPASIPLNTNGGEE